MREILFRGKRVYNGEWTYGFYFERKDTSGKIIESVIINDAYEQIMYGQRFLRSNMLRECSRIAPSTVGQFTGLTDKNGKRIFEGDIIVCRQEICGNWIDYCVEIGFVEMKYGAFGLHRKQGYYRPFKDWLEDYEYEIIGNIHDNPALLEVHND